MENEKEETVSPSSSSSWIPTFPSTHPPTHPPTHTYLPFLLYSTAFPPRPPDSDGSPCPARKDGHSTYYSHSHCRCYRFRPSSHRDSD